VWRTTTALQKQMHERHGTGCRACIWAAALARDSLAVRAPEVAAEWHPTRNGKLRPDGVLSGTERNVWWRCRVDPAHVWKAPVNRRARKGNGCPECAEQKNLVRLSRVTADHSLLVHTPELAREWHPKRNGSLTPAGVSPFSNKKVWWRCKLNRMHEWCAVVKSRSRGSGCPDCCRESRVSRSRRGTERAASDPALRPAPTKHRR
jgi:hypothetical protein